MRGERVARRAYRARRDLLTARRDLFSKARIVVARLELYPDVVAAGARRARARAAECAIRARSQLAELADDRTAAAAARDEGSAGVACASGVSQLRARARTLHMKPQTHKQRERGESEQS